ncbi:hypothetical protein C0584_03270 [Candidatus Parcubacteria bacterium]|nr:MAG: hypothetical protein C0584_03270 [Candidatus Parcubacteria bacterium]
MYEGGMKAKKFFIVNFIMFIVASLVVLGLGFFVFMQNQKVDRAIAAGDETPPDISNIVVSDTTSTSTMIQWKTSEESDSLINYSLNRNYGVSRDPHFDKTEHTIFLDDLLPNSQYFFRITSTDASGNQKISNDFTFTTEADRDYSYGNLDEDLGAVCAEMFGDGQSGVDQEGKVDIDVDIEQLEEIEEVEEKELLLEILERIDQVQEEKTLEIIEEHIQAVAEDIVSELSIILSNADIEVGTDYVIIYWQTNKEANSIVSLALDESFDYDSEDPYTWNEGEPDDEVTDHRIEITGLEPATTYHFQVSSKTILEQEAKSEDKTFTTKSVLPVIQNLSLSKVEETSATIAFTTNIPTTAIIEYTNLNNGESKLEGQSAYITNHTIRLNNLIFDTYYSAIVTVENEQNEKAVSEPLTFITTRDEDPPTILKVNTESTLYPGADNKVQTIISYETDELAKCQLNYHRGIIPLDGAEVLPEEEDPVTDHVQVVTNFLPANVYKFWIVCRDDALNQARSQDFTMLTPSQEESIIDIILKNFEGTFGWIKNIKM